MNAVYLMSNSSFLCSIYSIVFNRATSMSARVLSMIILLFLGLADAGVLQRVPRDTPCSQENLNAILQSCQESVIPESTETTIASQFCGSSCRDKIADYASSCGHTSFSVNITGTCLVNNNHPQCIFAVIIIKPGILSCKASATTTNNEPSSFTINSNIPPVCSLYSSYNSTGEYFQIEFDPSLNQPVIRPPLLPPWSNCSIYYNNFAPVLPTDEPMLIEEIECSQNQLDIITQDCEEAVRTANSSNISQRFCGESCRSRVSAYAAACNLSHFSLNVTGTCQTSSTDTQCVFAIVLIRPGVSACSATINLREYVTMAVATQADLLQEPCCILYSSVNTTGEFYEVHPDPLTGTPFIQPPLTPPWESCSAYTDLTCNAMVPTVATTTVTPSTAKATTPTTPKPVSTTTTELPSISDSALSVHHSYCVMFYILTFIIILNIF